MFWIWFLCGQLIRTHTHTFHGSLCQRSTCWFAMLLGKYPSHLHASPDSSNHLSHRMWNPVIGAHVWLGLVFPVTYLWDETYFEGFAMDLRLFKLVISNSWAVRWFFLGSFQGEFGQKMATSSILGTSLVSLRCVYLWCPWNHSYRTFFSFFPGPLKSWGSFQDVTEEHHNELEDTHISY